MEGLRIIKLFGFGLLVSLYFLWSDVNLLPKLSGYLLVEKIFFVPQKDKLSDNPMSLREYVKENEVYLERVQRLQRSCIENAEMYIGKSTDKEVKSNINIDRSLNISVCTIQKVGSKFIKSLLEKLSTESNIKDKTGYVSYDKNSKDFRFIDADKVMVVREPYSRAVSGYVDKLFTPNTVYWHSFGRNIITHVRKDPTPLASKCGHDVTFPEFVKYLIMNELKSDSYHRDHHFTPLHEHCRPCQIPYDFIGKFESFKDDILFLLKVWNKRFSTNITFGDFEAETAESRAEFQSLRLFKMRKDLKDCSSFYNATVRTWRSLQMRGLIPITESFPFDPIFTENNMTQKDLFLAAKNAMLAADDKAKMRAQREEALVEAFSLISENDLQDLSKIFLPDCKLFGYEPKPAIVFNRTRIETNQKLKYFII